MILYILSTYNKDKKREENLSIFHSVTDAIYVIEHNVNNLHDIGKDIVFVKSINTEDYNFDNKSSFVEFYEWDDKNAQYILNTNEQDISAILNDLNLTLIKSQILLDLNKISDKDFKTLLKDSYETKDYTQLRKAIQNKERETTQSINNVLDDLSNEITKFDNKINDWLNKI